MNQAYTDDQIVRINEVFHDFDAESYAHIHPEIFTEETKRWQRLLRMYLPKNTPLHIVDIGCGTGFIGMQLQNFLQPTDVLHCTDISEKMLLQCKKNLQSVSFTTTYDKIQSINFILQSNTYDVIVINSVLHHVPNYEAAINQMIAALKPGGILYIGHEPNSRFIQSTFLRKQFILLRSISPKAWVLQMLQKVGLRSSVAKKKVKNLLLNNVNTILLKEKIIAKNLEWYELSALIDIHSFTAGGMHVDRGFDCKNLLKKWHNEVDTIHIETYNHLSKMSRKYWFLRPYERLLKYILPLSGSTFFVVARKKHM